MYTDARVPPTIPPNYNQAVGGVEPVSPLGPAQGQPVGAPVIVTTVIPVGPNSTRMTCPHCHTIITSQITKEPGMMAYISGLIIALFGCVLGCCLIPCCMDECMVVHHRCPKCNGYIGRYRR